MAITISKITKDTKRELPFSEVKEYVLSVAKDATPENKLDIEVLLSQGRHEVEEPLVFSAEEHPFLANVRLTIKAAPSMRPTVTGLKNIPGAEFTAVEGTPYYKYQLAKKEDGTFPVFRDFFCNGQRMKLAESPTWINPFSFLPEERKGEKKLEGLYIPMEIAQKLKETGVGKTQLRMSVQWEHAIMNVKDVDLSVTKEVNGEPYALITFFEEFDSQFVCGIHRANNIGGRPTYFINNPAFLTEPGSFVYDWGTGTVYLVPPVDFNMARGSFGYTTMSSYLEFKGMQNVTIEGITFVGLTSPYAFLHSYFGMLSNCEFRAGKLRHAAIVTSDIRNFKVRDCSFLSLGTNGVMMCDRAVHAEVTDCVFKDVGMCGVDMGNYRVGDGWNDESNRLFQLKVKNNYFEHIAYDYPSTACIFLDYCDGAEISHNTIKGCAYSGIAAGDGYSKVGFALGERVNMRDVEIAYNHILDFMDVGRDGGAIYVTGANCRVDYARRFNFIHHNYATLADSGHTDRRGYYLDGAASNWDVYDNVIDNCQLPLFTQYHVPSQYTHHNRVWNFYSTTFVDTVGNHRPFHDTLLENCCVENSLEELFEKHPAAKAIADGAGYRDTGIND